MWADDRQRDRQTDRRAQTCAVHMLMDGSTDECVPVFMCASQPFGGLDFQVPTNTDC
jgi:hypothetical protein